MDLTKECANETLQGKRTASEMARCEEEVKKIKFNTGTASVIYDPVTDSKENVPEMALDMSRGSKCDIVDVGQKSQSVNVLLLREKLRNEETALLLLRKLQQSQLSLSVRSGISLVGSNIRQNYITNNLTATSQSNTAGQMLPRQQFNSHIPLENSSVRHVDGRQQEMSRQLQGHKQMLFNRTTMLKESNVRDVDARQQELNRQLHGHKQLLMNRTTMLKESNVRPQPPRPPVVVQQTHEQTLAQRQALAKLTIRRQLEATLLQIPRPKFTPQEMSFIPTFGFYADFIALVGMEEAVTCILNEEATSELAAEDEKLQPLQCANCQTDHTPQWKPEEQGAKTVICEQCAVRSRKQAFRREHTTRLMAAFRQALQQERQIEIGGEAVGCGMIVTDN